MKTVNEVVTFPFATNWACTLNEGEEYRNNNKNIVMTLIIYTLIIIILLKSIDYSIAKFKMTNQQSICQFAIIVDDQNQQIFTFEEIVTVIFSQFCSKNSRQLTNLLWTNC